MYIENPKGSKKLFELINQFNRTSAYTINTDNRFLFLYTCNKQPPNKSNSSNSIYGSIEKNSNKPKHPQISLQRSANSIQKLQIVNQKKLKKNGKIFLVMKT